MYEVLITTKPWIDEFAQEEINKYSKSKSDVIEKGFYKISFENSNDLFESIINLIYYSRTIENIYLKFAEFIDINKVDLIDFEFGKELSFEVDGKGINNKNEFEKIIGSKILEKYDNLKVDLSNPDLTFKILNTNRGCAEMNRNTFYLGLDLAGFKLTKRDYKLNINSNSINSQIPNYCFYLMNLEKEERFSLLDPAASLGETIIEASLFNPRKPLNLKKRYNMTITKIFGKIPQLPKGFRDDNKYIAIVQNNKIFKQLRENINYSSQKIKISQYDFDWLDVKLKESEVDYVISNFPSFKEQEEFEKFQEGFFYQAEFITAKKVCVISKKQVSKKIVKKHNLKIMIEKQVEIGEQMYNIYIIG